MSLDDFLISLTRFILIALGILTLLEYLRYRDKTRFDIALMFNALMLAVIASWFGDDLIGRDLANILFGISLLAHPYLLLRLTKHFRTIPSDINHAALAGYLLSAILFSVMPNPVLMIVILPIVVYYIVLECYTALLLLRSALESAGVTRWRLSLAAAGSAFLAGLVLVLAFGLLFPDLSDFSSPWTPVFAAFAALSYYLAFATPRRLRQFWQYTELYRFLETSALETGNLSGGRLDLLLQYALKVVTGIEAFIVYPEGNGWQIARPGTTPLDINLLTTSDEFMDAWRMQRAVALPSGQDLPRHLAPLMDRLNADTILVVPIKSPNRAWGLLIVFLHRGRLFIREDLELLSLFAEQSALLLDHESLLEEQRHLNEQLQQEVRQQQQAQAEIRRLNSDLERRVQERTTALRTVNEELEAFAYTVSHDLRAPLRALNSYSQFIREDCQSALSEMCLEYVEGIAESATDMENLVVDLLEYSRIGRAQMEFTQVDVGAMLRRLVDWLKLDGNAVVHLPDIVPVIEAPEMLLQQIFMNLLSNAAKFTRPGVKPEIRVHWREDTQAWHFTVIDNGIGMEQRHLKQIFGMFQRLHTADQYEGTGIGLAIVKKAVDVLGGAISVESTVGEGSQFTVTIPKQIDRR